MDLKNKRVLITAGPTWVSIDNARVISNISSGETGVMLAKKLRDLGARVTLLLGPVGSCCPDKKIRMLRFKFFHELNELLTRELSSRRYAIVIHSAAVSDYKPVKVLPEKINSGLRRWRIDLVPTPKIIDSIKKIGGAVYLIGFKFEPGKGKTPLIQRTRDLFRRTNLDLAVANTIQNNRYQAYILERDRINGPYFSKSAMVNCLTRLILNF